MGALSNATQISKLSIGALAACTAVFSIDIRKIADEAGFENMEFTERNREEEISSMHDSEKLDKSAIPPNDEQDARTHSELDKQFLRLTPSGLLDKPYYSAKIDNLPSDDIFREQLLEWKDQGEWDHIKNTVHILEK